MSAETLPSQWFEIVVTPVQTYAAKKKTPHITREFFMEIRMTSSPNNEISIGIQSMGVRTKKAGDNSQDNIKNRLAVHYGNAQVIAYNVGRFGCIENHCESKDIKVVSRSEVARVNEAKSRSLDIIHEVQSKKTQEKLDVIQRRKSRPGYGFLGRVTRFTRLARHRILCAGNIIRKSSQAVAESTFITLTVPGDTPNVASHIAKWASHLINGLLQVVRNSDRRERETPTNWFYVWENQKRGVLHLHLVLHCSTPGRSYRLGHDVANAWWRKLKAINSLCEYALFTRRSGKECVLPELWQSDVQPVRKCVASYVSKYVSKESQHSVAKGSKSKAFAPPRWWGMARNLVQSISESSSTVTIGGLSEDVATQVYLEVRSLLEKSPGFVLVHSYSFDLNHGDYHVGSGFRDKFYLDSDFYEKLSPLLGVHLRNIISRVSGVKAPDLGLSYTGKNWLLSTSNAVTTISNHAMMRWYE
ncbi:hypothetical protein QT972_33445 [Microcoleus sp. herbarium7]|uniref:rolling circle replication-associated protein n=1 Tax=Microcoleus sp. herbarium7 TaxID=3055435 RepID=UPI002FD3EFB2